MFAVGHILKRIIRSISDDAGERVVAVADNGATVTTQHEGVRCEYRGVVGSYSVGDIVTDPIRHLKRLLMLNWSPWDGEDED